MKVFSYYRVSSDLQEDSWLAQKKACRDYAREHELEILQEFVEKSSAFDTRPIFDKMLKRLTEVSGILVFDLDRLVRDPYQFAKILNLFQSSNKRIFQVIGEIDPSRDEDVLLARIKTDIADYEVKKMKRRMRSGIQRYIEEHGHWGRPRKKIDKKQFKKFIEDGKLIFPKTVIAKLFNVSPTKLRQWMRENNFGELIEELPIQFQKENCSNEV